MHTRSHQQKIEAKIYANQIKILELFDKTELLMRQEPVDYVQLNKFFEFKDKSLSEFL